MKKGTKFLYLFASCLIVFGLIIAAIGFFSGAHYSVSFNGTSVEVDKHDTLKKKTVALKAFENVNIDINDADISFIPSDEYKVELSYLSKQKWTCEVKNGTLFIKYKDHNEKARFSLNFGLSASNQAKIKIYVPKEQMINQFTLINKYGDTSINGLSSQKLSVESNDGDLALLNISTNSLSIANEYGDSVVKNVSTNDFSIAGNDGDMLIQNLNAMKATVSNKYGDIAIRQVNSKGLTINSTDGDLSLSGSLKGMTEINSDYGDVWVKPTNNQKSLGYQLKTQYGDIIVNNKPFEGTVTSSEHNKDMLTVKAQDGDIALKFQ
ncbi:DUF4097 family beta strand repeat-containing protein [Bacillus sp. 1P06AnD]|uniref:DUF4097 family beta strand repeat-containing protein n=1 Tax=Bacillus sp. 1P06AnD TaxID=3132208 RepID=UPI0039A06B5D